MAASKKVMTRGEWEKKLNDVKIGKEDMNELVMNFLVTEGFVETAEKFRKESGTKGLKTASEVNAAILTSQSHEKELDDAKAMIDKQAREIDQLNKIIEDLKSSTLEGLLKIEEDNKDMVLILDEVTNGLEGADEETASDICCSCTRFSTCKTIKCKCRVLGSTCGSSCGCRATKCANRAGQTQSSSEDGKRGECGHTYKPES